ncbi:hypothetical protein [[Mycoplasma] gypis]|uniref:Uncharacterized protein n=1 Tax=[Mycoplasma] gypis TaxID=92404 RepID=A0ABZ2RNP2_9BACT|nr:hypothetical protein [[Mycoplasma] gypis]MBN0919437.1 hypothetical protein [[Mycoplasma] gypis]
MNKNKIFWIAFICLGISILITCCFLLGFGLHEKDVVYKNKEHPELEKIALEEINFSKQGWLNNNNGWGLKYMSELNGSGNALYQALHPIDYELTDEQSLTVSNLLLLKQQWKIYELIFIISISFIMFHAVLLSSFATYKLLKLRK